MTRLYLVSPATLDHPDIFAATLRAALDGGDVAAFLLSLPDSDDKAIVRAADTLRPVCQQRGVAFLIDGRPDLAVKLDCDGVQIAIEDYAEARRTVGSEHQVGVAATASRHLAMEAAEAGADYVTFDAGEIELIQWWGELFEIPCVAAGAITAENAAMLAAAGADFLAVGTAVWDHADGPQTAVQAFNNLLPAEETEA